MKSGPLYMFMLLSVLPGRVAAKGVTTSDLLDLFKSRIEVFSKGDTVGIKSICTKDYQCINSMGSKMGAEEIKQYIATQKKEIKAYNILSFNPFVSSDESLAFVVSEIEEEIVQDNVITRNSLIITEVYRKESRNWKILLTQISQKICNYP